MTKTTVKNIILGILLTAAGIVLVAAPQTSIKIVIILLGMGAVINGIFNLVRVRSLSDDSQFKMTAVIRGAVSIVVGLLACIIPMVFFSAAETVIRVMLYIFGVYLVLSAFAEFFLVSKLHEIGVATKMFSGEAVVSIIVAVILFMLPANFGIIIIRVFGIALILCGIAFAVYSFRNRVFVVEPDSIKDAAVEEE